MRKIGMKLLTMILLLTVLVSGYTGGIVAAATSEIGIHVVRHIDHDKGTTRAAITIQGLPQEAKGLQFDLIISSDINELSMTWNPVFTEYKHYQDMAIGDDKVQRTYYIVAKSMPLESNSLYIGEAIYNNTDVKFETSGEVIWLGDQLQQTRYQAALKVETKYENPDTNGGNNNNGSGGGSDNDSSTSPPADDEDKSSTDDEDKSSTDDEDKSSTDDEDKSSTDDEDKPSTDDEDKSSTDDEDKSSTDDEDKPSTDDEDKPSTDDEDKPSTDDEGETNTDKPVSFQDIDGHWAASSIQYVASKGIMNGTGEDKFEPNVTMTRAMFVQTLFNAEKVLYETNPQGNGNSFKDVVEGSWYEEAVNWAVKQGITSGLGNHTFGPHQEISREQIAVMIYQYCKLKGIDLPKADKEEFEDQDKISSWAEEAVAAIHGASIMNGMNGNWFEPQAKAKRAEVAAVVERLAKIILLQEE